MLRLRIARTDLVKLRIELDARTQQQHVALKRRQVELFAHAIECRRRFHRRGDVERFTFEVCNADLLGFRVLSRQNSFAHGEPARHQVASVRLQPSLLRRHAITTCGSTYWPVFTFAVKGLSAPSTCTRSRYVPAFTPRIGIAKFCVESGGLSGGLTIVRDGAMKLYETPLLATGGFTAGASSFRIRTTLWLSPTGEVTLNSTVPSIGSSPGPAA